MKKTLIVVLFLIISVISLLGAGKSVFDIRLPNDAGIAYFDTIKCLTVVSTGVTTMDSLTISYINVNKATLDTITGAILFQGAATMGYVILDSTDAFKSHGDITIGAGYELYADSAAIDTVASLLLLCDNSAKFNGKVIFSGGSDSTIIDSMFYVNGSKDTAWVYVNGVKMILATEP